MLEKNKKYGAILMVAAILVAICTFVGSYGSIPNQSFANAVMWTITYGGFFGESYGPPEIMTWWILLPCLIAFSVGGLAWIGALPLTKPSHND